MEKENFEAVLVLLVPQVVGLSAERYGYDEITAVKELYASEVYSALEQEDTKVWHLSPLMLFHMFDEEKRTGMFIFPEEA